MTTARPWARTIHAINESRSRYREAWAGQALFSRSTLSDVFREGAQRFGDRKLIYGSVEQPVIEMTVAQTYQKSLRVAAAMQALNLKAGDIIMAQLPHRLENQLVYMAAQHLGIIVNPLVHIYGAAEMGFILRQTRARALFTPAAWRNIDYVARFRQIRELPDLEHVIVLGGGSFPGPSLSWEDFLGRAPPADPAPHAGDPEDLATVIFTSGTTSQPKGVMHVHESIITECKTIDTGPGPRMRYPQLVVLPAGHVSGVNDFVRPFIQGCDQIHIDHFDAALAVDLARSFGAAYTAATPFQLNEIMNAAGDGPQPIRFAATGASSVPPSLVQRGDEIGIKIVRGYGSTEHPSISMARWADPLSLRAHTDGPSLAGSSWRIVGEDGVPVPDGESGEILSMGPELFRGYFNAELNADAFDAAGRFHTGDIGVMDAKGYLSIVDRKKDIIIRGGENLSSREIEDVLHRHPAVAEAAVVSWPDRNLGERVGAFVILRQGSTLDIPQLKAFFAESGLAKQKTPERLEIVEEFPRTPLGKIKKDALRNRVRQVTGNIEQQSS